MSDGNVSISQAIATEVISTKTMIEGISGLLVLLMHLGFTLIEAGSVRTKHTASVFARNLISLIISILIFWILGYAFAFGSGHFFIGYNFFCLYDLDSSEYSAWFLHAALSSLPPVIVAGALAERCHITGLLTYTSVMSALIYPLTVHWAWASDGWLYTSGFVDVGGAGCLHLVAGVAALTGACIIGRRDEVDKKIEGHSLPMSALGGGLVILGMVGKEVGLAVSIDDVSVVGRAATSCLVAGAGGGLMGVVAWKVIRKKWSYYSCLNGWVAGMVAVSAGGPLFINYNSWASLVVGLIGGLLYCFTIFIIQASELARPIFLPAPNGGIERIDQIQMKQDLVDDPVHAIAVHLLPGLWGLISVPLLTDRGLLGDEEAVSASGVFLGWQLAGAAAMMAWTVIFTVIAMFPLLPMGKLRISPGDEKDGMDSRKTEESAYSMNIIMEGSKDINLPKGVVSPRSREFIQSTQTLFSSSQKLYSSNKMLAPKIVIQAASLPPKKETILTRSASPLYQPKDDESVDEISMPPPMPESLSMPNLIDVGKWQDINNMSHLSVPGVRKYVQNHQNVSPKSIYETKPASLDRPKTRTPSTSPTKIYETRPVSMDRPKTKSPPIHETRPASLDRPKTNIHETRPASVYLGDGAKTSVIAERTALQAQRAALKKQKEELRHSSNAWTSPSLIERENDVNDSSGMSSENGESKVEKAIRNVPSFNYLCSKPMAAVQNVDALEEEKEDVFIADENLLEETDEDDKKKEELTLQDSSEEKRKNRLSSTMTPAKNLFKELTDHGETNDNANDTVQI